ncbi:sulfur carrier protein ThiS [Priestia koreensis]|uniref:Thiamine biosynthesis protein ThiS n=1 Tax=Priestia koreensis TaxID=284581 RepID=A0A0M0L7P2_9BACI|nr:sulfur carrier protein ThiS [Priestia koreensis]KOO47116.1 thiamine biosynthesis protein ThiS [Priestia koreensis]
MNVKINGEDVKLHSSIATVHELLTFYEFEKRVVIVEVNEDILQKDQHNQTILKDGDHIEIVSFVGGG